MKAFIYVAVPSMEVVSREWKEIYHICRWSEEFDRYEPVAQATEEDVAQDITTMLNEHHDIKEINDKLRVKLAELEARLPR